MIRCHWCGAQNYAIDSWCTSCSRHLEWAPRPATPAAAPEQRRPPRRRALKLLAPAAAGLGVAIALALPVAGWFNAAGRAAPPALPNAAMRPVAPPGPAASTAPAEPVPTADATPTPDATATPSDLTQPGQTLVPTGDPAASVARFYQAVSGHDFVAAAALWTPRMQAQYPPAEYIDHRFAATQTINLRAERMVGDSGGHAIVYVDVLEVTDGQTRHWVGTWQVVDTASGWLLNRPYLQAAT